MPSKYGGIPVEESTGSKYGGIPVDEEPSVPAAPPEPGNHGLSEFITSPHGYFREGLSQAGQGFKELSTPGQRLRGASDVIQGGVRTLTPVGLGAAGAALATAPMATAVGLGGGAIGAHLGGSAGRALGGKVSPEAAQFGEDVGSLAGGALGGGIGATSVPIAKRMLPSAERAGANLQRVNQVVGDQPVNLQPASQPVLRALQLERTGAGAPPAVISKLSERLPQHGGAPVPFSEARDFQTNAGRLSVAESLNAKPQMKAQVAQLAKALAEENERVATEGGVGPLYKDAINEYRRAMKIQGAKEKAADVAKSTAMKYVLGGLAGGAGYATYRKLAGD